MAVLIYNGHTEQVCIDEVSISRQSIRHPSTGEVLGHKETWAVQATKIDAGGDLADQLTALEAAYAEDGHDLSLKTAADGTVLNQLDSSAAADGVKVTQRPSFPTLKGAEHVNFRTYTIGAEADFYDGDPDLLLDDQQWSYQIGQDEKVALTMSGKLATKGGVAASGYFAGRDPGTPEGYTRGPTSYQVNDDDTEMSYSYADREHWQALPAGVLVGGYTTAVSETGTGRTKKIAGRFVGPTASVDAAINALRLSGRRLLNESITEEPFGGAKSFSLAYEYSNRGTLEWRETVTIMPSRERQIYHEVLGGGAAVRQTGGKTTARASVSGNALGRTMYPDFPPGLWPAMYLTPGGERLSRKGPTRTADGNHTGYGISWNREYEFPLNVVTRLPRIR